MIYMDHREEETSRECHCYNTELSWGVFRRNCQDVMIVIVKSFSPALIPVSYSRVSLCQLESEMLFTSKLLRYHYQRDNHKRLPKVYISEYLGYSKTFLRRFFAGIFRWVQERLFRLIRKQISIKLSCKVSRSSYKRHWPIVLLRHVYARPGDFG